MTLWLNFVVTSRRHAAFVYTCSFTRTTHNTKLVQHNESASKQSAVRASAKRYLTVTVIGDRDHTPFAGQTGQVGASCVNRQCLLFVVYQREQRTAIKFSCARV